MNELSLQDVESKIIVLRGFQVLLDSDVAELYGVETKRINEAVKNNPNKFPEGYILLLTSEELSDLRSKISTTKLTKTRAVPKVFTEKGLYMLATILKSTVAVQTTIAIIETFSKIRQLTQVVSKLSGDIDDVKKKSLMAKSGEIMAEILYDGLTATDTETTFELNFAVLKLKHIIKKKKADK